MSRWIHETQESEAYMVSSWRPLNILTELFLFISAPATHDAQHGMAAHRGIRRINTSSQPSYQGWPLRAARSLRRVVGVVGAGEVR